ncbi:MAG TPA: Spy/CpxP family protein refolding chaperone [Trichocoleus sp.]
MNLNFTSFWQRISSGKGLPLLVGAVSLALSAAAVPAVLAQASPNGGPGGPGGGPGGCMQSRLNLTDEQQTQIDSIRQSEREQMDAILTADQRARLETARANQEDRRQVFESLNLTDEQRTQMRTIHEAAREQIEAILTPEQLQQLPQRPSRGDRTAPPNGEQLPR